MKIIAEMLQFWLHAPTNQNKNYTHIDSRLDASVWFLNNKHTCLASIFGDNLIRLQSKGTSLDMKWYAKDLAHIFFTTFKTNIRSEFLDWYLIFGLMFIDVSEREKDVDCGG